MLVCSSVLNQKAVSLQTFAGTFYAQMTRIVITKGTGLQANMLEDTYSVGLMLYYD